MQSSTPSNGPRLCFTRLMKGEFHLATSMISIQCGGERQATVCQRVSAEPMCLPFQPSRNQRLGHNAEENVANLPRMHRTATMRMKSTDQFTLVTHTVCPKQLQLVQPSLVAGRTSKIDHMLFVAVASVRDRSRLSFPLYMPKTLSSAPRLCVDPRKEATAAQLSCAAREQVTTTAHRHRVRSSLPMKHRRFTR